MAVFWYSEMIVYFLDNLLDICSNNISTEPV